MSDEDFEEFRIPVIVKRKAGGAYVDGHWVSGAETDISITADIQTLSQEEMSELPEGRRIDQTSKMFTTIELKTINSDNPDIVLVGGVRYEVLACYQYQHNLINHYKVILQKCEQGL